MKKYFKVYTDFTKYIPIDETELEKALYAFQIGEPVIFENGAASRIESIIPDFNKSLGWSSEYKAGPEDTLDIDRIKPAYSGYIGKVKDKIQYLIQTNQKNLIGKNIEIPELSERTENAFSPEVKSLAERMRIK